MKRIGGYDQRVAEARKAPVTIEMPEGPPVVLRQPTSSEARRFNRAATLRAQVQAMAGKRAARLLTAYEGAPAATLPHLIRDAAGYFAGFKTLGEASLSWRERVAAATRDQVEFELPDGPVIVEPMLGAASLKLEGSGNDIEAQVRGVFGDVADRVMDAFGNAPASALGDLVRDVTEYFLGDDTSDEDTDEGKEQ